MGEFIKQVFPKLFSPIGVSRAFSAGFSSSSCSTFAVGGAYSQNHENLFGSLGNRISYRHFSSCSNQLILMIRFQSHLIPVRVVLQRPSFETLKKKRKRKDKKKG